jgi:hypothetical protein
MLFRASLPIRITLNRGLASLSVCFPELFHKSGCPTFRDFERPEAQAPRPHRIEFLLHSKSEGCLSGARLRSVPPTHREPRWTALSAVEGWGSLGSWYFFRTAGERWASPQTGNRSNGTDIQECETFTYRCQTGFFAGNTSLSASKMIATSGLASFAGWSCKYLTTIRTSCSTVTPFGGWIL